MLEWLHYSCMFTNKNLYSCVYGSILNFLLFCHIYIYWKICIVEPNAEPHSNLIGKFEFESNLIVVELEFELEPCDIGAVYWVSAGHHWSSLFFHLGLVFYHLGLLKLAIEASPGALLPLLYYCSNYLIKWLSWLTFLEFSWVFTECFEILCCMYCFALHITVFPN